MEHFDAGLMPMEPARAMKDRLRANLRLALLARRSADAAVLRTLIAAIDNKEAPPLMSRTLHEAEQAAAEVPRLRLDSKAVRDILLSEIAEREIAVAHLEAAGAPDKAEVLLSEVLLIRQYVD